MTYLKETYRTSKVTYYEVNVGWPWNPNPPIETEHSQVVPTRDASVELGEGGADWKERIARIEQAGTTMSVSDIRRKPCRNFYAYGATKDTLGNANVRYAYGSYWVVGFPNLVSISASSEDTANAKALTAYVKAIRKALTSVEGLVIAGEIMQTVRLLKNPLRAFRLGLDSYHRNVKKRLNGVKIRRTRTRIVADTWLEYMFGWRPLISDIDDISQHLANQTVRQGPPPHKVVTGVGRDESSGVKANHTIYSIVDRVAVKTNILRTHKTTVVYKGAVRTDKYQEYQHRSLGFGLDNFLPSLWELVPYSFLVDYFTNVGEFINAVTFNSKYLGWTMKWTVVEDRAQCADFWLRKPYPTPYKFQDMSATGSGMREVSRSIERSPYTGSLVPPLRFEIPGLGTKWLNIAALARLKS